jgi:hypothetical protein
MSTPSEPTENPSTDPDENATTVPRSRILQGGALAVGAATLGGAALTQTLTASPASADPGVDPNPRYDRPKVTRLATLTGPDHTTEFGFEATDLGAAALTPDGRILLVFGDTFEGAKVGSGAWMAPVALYADAKRSLKRGLKWTGAVGGKTATQLVDVITIGDTMYLWVMANAGFGNVVRTEIWTSTDSGEHWERTAPEMFAGDHLEGLSQQATWSLDAKGEWVYVLTTGFQRDKGAILQRVKPDAVLDPSAYEVYTGFQSTDAAESDAADAKSSSEDWIPAGDAKVTGDGKEAATAADASDPAEPTVVVGGAVGEMCLRIVEDKYVLSYFNAGLYRNDVLIADSPLALADGPFAETVLWGCNWGHEDGERVAQLYGGYILPGSTLNDLHLAVSQWHTGPDWPYHVQQYRIRGLGKGIKAEG